MWFLMSSDLDFRPFYLKLGCPLICALGKVYTGTNDDRLRFCVFESAHIGYMFRKYTRKLAHNLVLANSNPFYVLRIVDGQIVTGHCKGHWVFCG